MKIMVIGAGSYLGSYLVPFLRSKKVEVTPVHSSKLNWNEMDALIHEIQKTKPDYLFHLVGTREGDSLTELIRVNAYYASQLFEALIQSNNLIPVLVVGSAAEYGSFFQNPIDENQIPEPESFYGVSKYIQTLFAEKARQKGLPVIVARLFNLMGPEMAENLFLGKLESQFKEIIKGSRKKLDFKELNSSRDYIDVEDVVSILYQLILCPKAYGQTVNICSGRPIKIYDIVDKIKINCHIQTEVQTAIRQHSNDFSVIYGSTKKLFRLIGTYPFTDLKVSLEKISKNILDGQISLAA